MPAPTLLRGLCAVLATVSLAAFAQSDPDVMESDWIELVKGYKGESLGTELVDIEQTDGDPMQRITLAIPKISIPNPDDIEEVVVVGQMPDQGPSIELPKIEFSYEWLDDYDNDNYGLVIKLGRNARWPIRLYMNSNPGFKR